jgi:multidrug efflux pump subunit AcrA (membrane-fusion protein)
MRDGESRNAYALSFRGQLLLVGVAAPLAIFLLVVAPYYFRHYFVYKDAYLLLPPPAIGGPRALEGHWADVPTATVKPEKFSTATESFGWLDAIDERTTSVLPTASGAIRQVYVKVGDTVAQGALLFAFEPASGAPESARDQPAKDSATMINAPLGGVVTRLNADVGFVVANSPKAKAVPLASISDLSSLSLTAEMDIDDARSFHAGDPIEARPTTAPDRTIKGQILGAAPLSDPDSGRAKVTATVNNPDGSLRPNNLVRFARPGGDSAETLAVPMSAVLFENGSTRVWVVAADRSKTLTPRTIRIGRIANGMVEVVDGLTRDDQVATSETVFIDRAAKGY